MADCAYERLSDFDSTFLVFENPCAHMHVGATKIFAGGPLTTPEGGIDVERIRRYVESRLHLIPRYRQRLQRTPIENHPIWIDDDHFNLFYHVRHTRLPPPGEERQLKRVAGRLMSQPLDFHKPLWEMWVIEGLAGGRFAVVTKTHHCMIDGISGVDLLSTLLTPEPTAAVGPVHRWVPRPAPSAVQLVRSEIGRRLGAPLAIAGAIRRLLGDEGGVRHQLAERLRAAARLLQTGLRNASSTPFNQPIGPFWRFDWLPMPLDAVRTVKRRLGGTVNDIVLATVAGAVRRFLWESRHIDVQSLDFRVLAPVSTRTDAERGTLGNRVAAWIVPLPLDERDPLRRLERIRRTTAELKVSRQALAADMLTQVTEWTGTTLLSLGARLMTYARPFNLVVTNVPGPQTPLHLLGSRMLEAHPMVPLFGNLAAGIALFSYDGTLYWGFTADWEHFPDLHDFVEAIGVSFHELYEAAAGRGPEKLSAGHRPGSRQRRLRLRGSRNGGGGRASERAHPARDTRHPA
jgi:WS/DGAT/MGAT family acyltransferase